jgi:hypothetical protein
LLREPELGAGGEEDLVIGGEQGDQGDYEASNCLDPTLEIEAAAPAGTGRSFCQFWRRFK